MKQTIRYTLLALAVAAMASCSGQENAGGTVETENTLALRILDSSGTPIPNATVKIRPVSYVPDTLGTAPLLTDFGKTVHSDSLGWIRYTGIGAGTYQVEARSIASGNTMRIAYTEHADQLIEDSLLLAPLGSIHGQVELFGNVHYAWVQILGTDYVAKTDTNGIFELRDIPAGAYGFRILLPGIQSMILESDLQVKPAATTDLGVIQMDGNGLSETWRYVKILSVSEYISEWMQPLQYPMVLTVRLSQGQFDFSRASASGSNCALFDSDNRLLTAQFAYWDSSDAVGRLLVHQSAQDTATQWSLRCGDLDYVAPRSQAVWEGVGDSLRLELNSILVGNFEGSSQHTSLPAPIPATYWYMFASDSTVQIEPAPGTDLTKGYQAAGYGRTGKAFHIAYTATNRKWAHLGAPLDSAPRSLRAMDSIEFYVRGNGRYQFSLDRITDDNPGKTIHEDTVLSEWTRVRLRPKDFAPVDSIGGNTGWNAVRDSLTNITFFCYLGTDFWLDDIRIYGLNRDDLK